MGRPCPHDPPVTWARRPRRRTARIPALARSGRAGSWIRCRRARHLAIAVDLGTGGCRRCKRPDRSLASARPEGFGRGTHARGLRSEPLAPDQIGDQARRIVEIAAYPPSLTPPVGHEHVPGSGADLEGRPGLARPAGVLAADRSDPASEVERWAIDGGELPDPRWVEEHLSRLAVGPAADSAGVRRVPRSRGGQSRPGLARNDDPVAACCTAGGRRNRCDGCHALCWQGRGFRSPCASRQRPAWGDTWGRAVPASLEDVGSDVVSVGAARSGSM